MREACDFVLVRYVPDPVRNEFVNIGVLLRGEEGTRVRFTRDWARVRCMDPAADTAMLEALEAEMQQRLEHGDAVGEKPMRSMLEDTLSNGLQLSDAKPVLAESMAAELDELMKLYVERPARLVLESKPERGRAALARQVRAEFERAGVWPLMQKRIAAAEFTRPGDPLRVDCGYRNGMVRMFHAVSLEMENDLPKVLAFTVPQLADGLKKAVGLELQFTAVVEPLRDVSDSDDEAAERYGFAVQTMESAGVRVYTPTDLERAAQTARRELGLGS